MTVAEINEAKSTRRRNGMLEKTRQDVEWMTTARDQDERALAQRLEKAC